MFWRKCEYKTKTTTSTRKKSNTNKQKKFHTHTHNQKRPTINKKLTKHEKQIYVYKQKNVTNKAHKNWKTKLKKQRHLKTTRQQTRN